ERLGDGATRQARVAADERLAAVHDHLWRVDRGDVERSPVLLLTVRERRGREPISPSEPIPVIDVLAERDDVRARDRLRVCQCSKERVCGRAARTAFRREQLDQHRRRFRHRHGGAARGESEREDARESAKRPHVRIVSLYRSFREYDWLNDLLESGTCGTIVY